MRSIETEQNNFSIGVSGQHFLRANDIRVPKLVYGYIAIVRRDVGRPKKR